MPRALTVMTLIKATAFAGAGALALVTWSRKRCHGGRQSLRLAGRHVVRFWHGLLRRQDRSLRVHKGYYTNSNGPNSLGLSIRCANASAKVELRASLNYANGSVSGDWEERTYNQSGSVAGKASSNRLSLAISGGITGSMNVSISGGSHQVSVSTRRPDAQRHSYFHVALRPRRHYGNFKSIMHGAHDA